MDKKQREAGRDWILNDINHGLQCPSPLNPAWVGGKQHHYLVMANRREVPKPTMQLNSLLMAQRPLNGHPEH